MGGVIYCIGVYKNFLVGCEICLCHEPSTLPYNFVKDMENKSKSENQNELWSDAARTNHNPIPYAKTQRLIKSNPNNDADPFINLDPYDQKFKYWRLCLLKKL